MGTKLTLCFLTDPRIIVLRHTKTITRYTQLIRCQSEIWRECSVIHKPTWYAWYVCGTIILLKQNQLKFKIRNSVR